MLLIAEISMMELDALMELIEVWHNDRTAVIKFAGELRLLSQSFSISCLTSRLGATKRKSISVKKPRVSVKLLLAVSPAAAVQFHHRPERKCTMGKSLAKVFQIDFFCFLEERGALKIFRIQQKWDEWKPFLVHSWIASFWTNIWLVWKAISSWKALRGFDLKIPAWGEAGRRSKTRNMSERGFSREQTVQWG